MSRANDPRVLEVLAMHERVSTSPEVQFSPSLAGWVLAAALGFEDEERFGEWPHAAMRDLLVAYLVTCPEDELDQSVVDARSMVRSCEHAEVVLAYERATDQPWSSRADVEAVS